MINAYKNFFKGYVDFTGRSTRSEYWWIWLTNMILLVPFYSVYFKALANPRNEAALMALGGIAIIYMIFGIALFLPGLALTVRLVLLAMPTKQVEVVTTHWNEVKEDEGPVETSITQTSNL